MRISSGRLDGIHLIALNRFADERGVFIKTFHEQLFAEAGILFSIREQFFSASRSGVIRGMHFQTPPFAHSKLVICLSGTILDVVVDIRKGSPTYGQCESFELDAAEPRAVLIAEGFAHGFLTLSTEATVLYNVSGVHEPAADCGVRWDTVGYPWPTVAPIVSRRDAEFPSLENFASPFVILPK